MDKPEHISLAAQRVLAGIESRRGLRPGGVREETPVEGNVTARAEWQNISGCAGALGVGVSPISTGPTVADAETRPERGKLTRGAHAISRVKR